MKFDSYRPTYGVKAPFAAACLIVGVALLNGCASTPDHQVDPIFNAVPGGTYACENAGDNRNVVVKGATSTAGQAVVGGAAGGVLGNQFGSGSGRDIATGVGVAAGAAAGAWNANRMANNRLNDCRQQQPGGGNPYQYRYQGG